MFVFFFFSLVTSKAKVWVSLEDHDLVTRVINKNNINMVVVTYKPKTTRVLLKLLTKSHDPPSRVWGSGCSLRSPAGR